MLTFHLSQPNQLACRAPIQPSSSSDQRPAAGAHQDMDSLLSTIQDQYFSAVASTLSRAIVLARSGAVGQQRCEKVAPAHPNEPHPQQQPRSMLDSRAQQARLQQQHQNPASRRRALNKQHHQRHNNGPASNPAAAKPLDLTKRRPSEESEPPTSSSSTHAHALNLEPDAGSLLFPLNLVTKSEVANVGGAISSSGLVASSTVSPASSGSPTSSLSSCSSAISSSGPASSEFEGARGGQGPASEALKSRDKKQQRRRPTKKLKGAKSHMCGQCGRSFSRSDMLTRHSRLHSGLKPYQCAKCLQVFSRSDHLSTHERTHTGEKPYQCRFCSYSACRRDMITRHMRTHTVGALTNGARGNSPASMEIQMELEARRAAHLAPASEKTQRSRRRQNNPEPDNSLEHEFFQHSETGPTQQLVRTQIEHFHRP